MSTKPYCTKPYHWIGIRKGWQENATTLQEALVTLPPQDQRTHVLLTGATGSGKTTLLHHLVSQDISLEHSFLVLDARGDFAQATLELCAGRVDPTRLAVLDLREKERLLGFNPLRGAGEPYFRALGVLDVIAEESESWGVQIAETLRNAVMLLAGAENILTNIHRVFHDAPFRQALLTATSDPVVCEFWERYGQLSTDKQSSLATPVLNKVSLLLSTETLRRTLGSSAPLDLAKHLDQKGSVTVVSLAIDELHGAGRMMGNLVLASICREIFARVDRSEANRNPVRLYVDEFELFNTGLFEQILAEGRRFGLHLVLAHQTLAQLTTRMRSMLLNNVGAKAFFRCGRDDSSVLSKDLTGNATAIDFSALPTGEAMLWTRNAGVVHVEINRPLLSTVGTLSPVAQAFVRTVKPSTFEAAPPPVQNDGAERQSAPQDVPPNLEDWL